MVDNMISEWLCKNGTKIGIPVIIMNFHLSQDVKNELENLNHLRMKYSVKYDHYKHFQNR